MLKKFQTQKTLELNYNSAGAVNLNIVVQLERQEEENKGIHTKGWLLPDLYQSDTSIHFPKWYCQVLAGLLHTKPQR